MKTILIIFLSLLAIWIFFLFVFRIKLIRKQDQEIKKLNERIFEKDDFIVELIRKYGNPKEGVEFLNKLKSKLNQDE